MGLTLAEHELASLFPAYLRLDRAGRIVAAGPSIRAHAGDGLVGAAFFDRFRIERPANVADLSALRSRGRPMIVRLNVERPLRMRGIALPRADGLWLMLGHIPDLETRDVALELQFSDFSPTDGTLDMLLAAEMRSGLLAEARTLAEGLEEQKKAAERANNAKSAFLATMSHEIRTPMNGVLGLAAILAGTDLTQSQREMLDVMITSGKLLMDILNDVLDLSKIESGQIDLEEAPFDVAELAEGVRGLFGPAAASKGLELDVSVDAPEPWCMGDAVRVRQILVNLVSNALKFTDVGGVSVSVRLAGTGERRELRMIVRDTGIGMSAEGMGRLFRPFVQADSSTTRRFGGTGLGLAIAKLLCGQMQGDIRVESRLGRGSTFTVELPLAAARPPAESVADDGGPRNATIGAPHVLVVEDNATNQFVLTLFLSKLGYTFDLANHGAEALIAWERRPYDVILMDVEMPVLDGFEATRELRRREQAQGRAHTPIIALSADAMLENRDKARLVGMDDFVTKPIDLERLEGMIANQLSRPAVDSAPTQTHARA
ncbi:ATP-binding protein [Amaricoccus sp.]|uniref:ATP-binding protein n=1 Tax=Amaricoccus sp. TaxID=1872485 RepID=UPI001B478EA2|nr:ATP-binding protein [Amaricoccus sp.]MBP7242607.1 response regulator [Amaricoccus sp.]